MNITNFPSFKPSFKKLKLNAKKRYSMQFYHHDFNSEPFLHVDAYAQFVRMEEISEHGLIITIITPDTLITFSEKNHSTNISGDSVVFSSKHDDETYCIIDFI